MTVKKRTSAQDRIAEIKNFIFAAVTLVAQSSETTHTKKVKKKKKSVDLEGKLNLSLSLFSFQSLTEAKTKRQL